MNWQEGAAAAKTWFTVHLHTAFHALLQRGLRVHGDFHQFDGYRDMNGVLLDSLCGEVQDGLLCWTRTS